MPPRADDPHGLPTGRVRLVALLTLLAVLWAAGAVYDAVQDARRYYLGEGLRR